MWQMHADLAEFLQDQGMYLVCNGHPVIHVVDVEPDLVDEGRVGELDEEHLRGGRIQHQGGFAHALLQQLLLSLIHI